MDKGLRDALVQYLRRRFHGCAGIDQLAEDMVHEAWLRLRAGGPNLAGHRHCVNRRARAGAPAECPNGVGAP